MLKGILEGAILKVISIKETYAYEIAQALESYGFDEVSEGTVCPIMLRLQRKGYIYSSNIKFVTQVKSKKYVLRLIFSSYNFKLLTEIISFIILNYTKANILPADTKC